MQVILIVTLIVWRMSFKIRKKFRVRNKKSYILNIVLTKHCNCFSYPPITEPSMAKSTLVTIRVIETLYSIAYFQKSKKLALNKQMTGIQLTQDSTLHYLHNILSYPKFYVL